ncbi:MAG: M56 family metallopeptidase [Verrucomicrobiaceae bacterium]|nr:M56 family metallopeptidase [Verrucomicrobiaceae bacterium]
MNAFWTALAFKATLWASIFGVASMLVPAVLPRWRRAMALIGIWGLWLLPFMPALPMHGAQQGVSLPMATVSWPWMTWTWALGAVIGGLRLLREGIQLIHCTRKAHQGCVEGMEVHFSAEVAGPCMTGWLRPRVFLPEEASQWSAAAVNAALRHELQHVRQHDGLHRLVAAVLRAVFWWNPAVHALCSIYENESEVCCDLEAAEGVMTRREYGHLLLAHACGDHTMVLAPLFALRSSLQRRIERLITVRREAAGVRMVRWMMVAGLLMLGGWAMASIRLSPDASSPGATNEQSEAALRLQANPFPLEP